MVCVKGKQAADVFSLDQEVFALDRLLKRIDDNASAAHCIGLLLCSTRKSEHFRFINNFKEGIVAHLNRKLLLRCYMLSPMRKLTPSQS